MITVKLSRGILPSLEVFTKCYQDRFVECGGKPDSTMEIDGVQYSCDELYAECEARLSSRSNLLWIDNVLFTFGILWAESV